VVLVEVVSVQIGEFNQRLGLAFRIVLNHVLLIINLEGALNVLRDEERVRVLLLAEEVATKVFSPSKKFFSETKRPAKFTRSYTLPIKKQIIVLP